MRRGGVTRRAPSLLCNCCPQTVEPNRCSVVRTFVAWIYNAALGAMVLAAGCNAYESSATRPIRPIEVKVSNADALWLATLRSLHRDPTFGSACVVVSESPHKANAGIANLTELTPREFASREDEFDDAHVCDVRLDVARLRSHFRCPARSGELRFERSAPGILRPLGSVITLEIVALAASETTGVLDTDARAELKRDPDGVRQRNVRPRYACVPRCLR